MAIDNRFGGNLERANTGIRSLPQRDTISYADRESYGRGQIYNPQKGARDVSGYMEDDDYFNPNVVSRQMAVEGFPNAPREIANVSNFGGPFSSAANLRESLNYMKAIQNNPNLIDPMYADLYPDIFDFNPSNPDLYKTKEEQMEDAGSFEAMQMERYGRENPFLQMLKGIQTTDVTDPRGNVTTTEEIVDPGVYAMSPEQLSYMYGDSTDAPMTRPKQYIPNTMGADRGPEFGAMTGGLEPANIGFDRAGGEPALPPASLGFDRAGAEPALPYDLGFQRAGAEPALPPENIGMDRDQSFSLIPEEIGLDRSPEEILSAPENEDGFSFRDLLPAITGIGGPITGIPRLIGKGILDLYRNRESGQEFDVDQFGRDPIMDMVDTDISPEKYGIFGKKLAGGTTNNMAGELIRNGIDTQGLNSDEIIQLYNQNFGNPDADVDQFGIAGVNEDNAAVQSLSRQGYSMEQIMNIMASRNV